MFAMLVSDIRDKSQSSIEADGYALRRSIDRQQLLEIATSLGPIKTDPRHPQQVRHIRPQRSVDAEPNTLSSRYGMEGFPFHTDAAHWHIPPKFVLLYCVEVGSGNRPTYLIDSQSLGLTNPELSLLSNAVWRSGHVKSFLCTVTSTFEKPFSIRYDSGCMSPRSGRALKADELITAKLKGAECKQVRWQNGDLLILDNHRVLHARGSAERADPDRVIARILIGGSYEGVGF